MTDTPAVGERWRERKGEGEGGRERDVEVGINRETVRGETVRKGNNDEIVVGGKEMGKGMEGRIESRERGRAGERKLKRVERERERGGGRERKVKERV